MTSQQIYDCHKADVTNPCHNIPTTVQQHVNTTIQAMIDELTMAHRITGSSFIYR